jgi:hypothetical protein
MIFEQRENDESIPYMFGTESTTSIHPIWMIWEIERLGERVVVNASAVGGGCPRYEH